MTTVWVIEQGSYSDYRVVGVFSSRENAEKVLALLDKSPSNEAAIAEWPLDPVVAEINQGLRQWDVVMLRDGAVEKIEPGTVESYNIAGDIRVLRRGYPDRPPEALYATLWAKDEAHAVKIVNEHRQQWITDGRWPGTTPPIGPTTGGTSE